MKPTAKLILGVSILLVSCELAAQTFKCVDAAGKITYSGKKCSDLGLKDAGEVKDRLNVNPAVNVNPAYRPAGQEGGSSPRPAPVTAGQSADAPAAAEEPAQPDRRCFVVKTAKGNVTRCNDKPDE